MVIMLPLNKSQYITSGKNFPLVRFWKVLSNSKKLLSKKFCPVKKDKLVYLSLWSLKNEQALYLWCRCYFLKGFKSFRNLKVIQLHYLCLCLWNVHIKFFESLKMIQDNQQNILPVEYARALKIPIKVYVDKILNIISGCYFIKTNICNILFYIVYNIFG